MAYTTRTFDNSQELVDFLNDIIIGSPVGMGPFDLDGLKLTIATKEVTFVGNELRWPEIVAQINAVSAGSCTTRNYGHNAGNPRLAFIKPTQVLAATGTAKAILGLPAGAKTVGAFAEPQANIVQVFPLSNNQVVLIHT